MESKSERKVKLDQWLAKACPQGVSRCQAMPSDASTRQYYRVTTPTASYVAMDAPLPLDCRPFMAIAAALRHAGLDAPEVIASDVDNGFLLLSDFGDVTFLKLLNYDQDARHADDLYARALRALSTMQAIRSAPDYELPLFGREWMEQEWAWHQEWFLQKWLGLTTPVPSAVNDCYEQLITSALQQPQVFMHRDYHSANLMVLPDNRVGILDFQDAFIGPLTYDPVSLLRDAYIDWRPIMVEEYTGYYLNLLRDRGELSQVSQQTFMQWFDWMGLQRHIKALMTFTRKAVRDQDTRYLLHVPRTLNYIIKVSEQYPGMKALHDYYTQIVEPAAQRLQPLCVP